MSAADTIRLNPYLVNAADAYRATIEAAAGVTISVQHVYDEWPDGIEDYWHAWANRETDHAYASGMTSRTAASATGNTEIACLDSIAEQLRVNREARSAGVVVSGEVAA